jgi:SAM-dependent methyltransferase
VLVKVTREGERWEEIARQDPLWAVLAHPEGKYGRWSEREFFRHGAKRIDKFLTHGSTFNRPVEHQAALDFGCGVGRLTRALAEHFDKVTGVDISETMIQRARELNAGIENLAFRRNGRPDLSIFSDATFDLVACDLVLQHLPDTATVQTYLTEFVRVLKPDGLLVFQLPTSLPLATRLGWRRGAYRVLRRVGLPAHTLYWRLGLHPNRMLAVPGPEVTSWLKSSGTTVLDVVKDQRYYVTR